MPRIGEENWKDNLAPSISCIEDDEMFIRSDDNDVVNFSFIKIELEHCSNDSEIICATDEEIASYWGNNSVQVGLVYNYSQI